MTDIKGLLSSNKGSTYTPDSLYGDGNSNSGDLNDFNVETLSKRLGNLSESSNQENADSNMSDIEIEYGKFLLQNLYFLKLTHIIISGV